MVRPVVRDIFFLNQKSEPATKADSQIVHDLLDTLKANEAVCLSLVGVRSTGDRSRIF
jgi:peptide deformylase